MWRGDPSRPVVLIDTPGLCADEEDDEKADTRIVLEIVNILKKFGHINAFVIVLKSGQSRYVGQVWQTNSTLLFLAIKIKYSFYFVRPFLAPLDLKSKIKM